MAVTAKLDVLHEMGRMWKLEVGEEITLGGLRVRFLGRVHDEFTFETVEGGVFMPFPAPKEEKRDG